jgi:hypothetical protein
MHIVLYGLTPYIQPITNSYTSDFHFTIYVINVSRFFISELSISYSYFRCWKTVATMEQHPWLRQAVAADAVTRLAAGFTTQGWGVEQ